MRIACLLPAAGASSRMRGSDKLLELVDGLPCLRVMALRALDAALDVIVTVPSIEHPRIASLDDLNVELLIVPDAHDGMSASLRTAATHIANDVALMGMLVLPPDMPDIRTSDLSLMVEVFKANPHKIIQATTHDDQPGHPVMFPRHLLDEVDRLSGDRGGAQIVRDHQDIVQFVRLADQRARLDLDTPEAWKKWRASAL